MRAIRSALSLVVLALSSCVATAGRPVHSVPANKVDKLVVTTSTGSWHLVTLDSARVDSLRQAGVILEQSVDERPEVLYGPQLEYPDRARRECATGRVTVQAIVGRDGRAEPASVAVRLSVDPRFDRPSLSYVQQASFRPVKVQGATVRTLVNIPIDFKIRGAC
jgi:TonB family protein